MRTYEIIMYFPCTERGGNEEYMLTISLAARSKGASVFAAFPETDATKTLIDDFQKAGVQYSPLEIGKNVCRRMQHYLCSLVFFLRTIGVLRKIEPDHVIFALPAPQAAFEAIVAAAFLKIPATVVF